MRKAVQKMTETLQGRREAVTDLGAELWFLTARRSLPVPHELLEIIFQYSVHSYGLFPENLLLVCRTFYIVAMNCRTLWTDLDPVGASTSPCLPLWAGTFIQSRVARSNPSPLDIHFANVQTPEMTYEFAKKVADVPTLLQRCRSVVIFRGSELQFFQGFQPLLESLTLEISYLGRHSWHNPWESGGEYPNLRSLKLRTSAGRGYWPERLFRQLTQLEIEMQVLRETLPPYHDVILPIAARLRSLTLMVDYGLPQPVIHKSLQTLVLVYRMRWMVEDPNTLGEIICPELRRLEIQARFCELLSSVHLRYTQKLSDLCLVCRQDVKYGEEGALLLNQKWSSSIVELLRSIGTVKHLKLESRIELVSGVVEKIEADPTLCPDLVSLRAESRHPASDAHASKQERSLLLKLEARVSERYQQLRRE